MLNAAAIPHMHDIQKAGHWRRMVRPGLQQTIRACSACGPQVRAERLRHPSGVVGLQWSPSGLQQGAPQYEHLQVCPTPCQKTLQHIAPS